MKEPIIRCICVFEDVEKEYVVEEILEYVYDKDIKEWLFKVKWENYTNADSTWEPWSNLTNNDVFIDFFMENCFNINIYDDVMTKIYNDFVTVCRQNSF